jgi:hypothetical protein
MPLDPAVRHSFAVLVGVRAPCGPAGDEEQDVEWRTMRPIALGNAPATITVRLAISSPLAPIDSFEERLRLVVDERGTEAIASAPSPRAGQCAAIRDGAQRAECEVGAMVQDARARRDIISLSCRNDHLVRIRALRHRLRKHPRDAADHGPVVRRLRHQITALALAAEQSCLSYDHFGGYVPDVVLTTNRCDPSLDPITEPWPTPDPRHR